MCDIATNDPEIKSKTDSGKVTYCPNLGSFSQTITKVAIAMKPIFIIPPTKANIISNQQHPRQNNPMLNPIRNMFTGLKFLLFRKKLKGCRQRCKQTCFMLEN
tara:strand:+ start:397 stop:705 length:309 start_codon:yes stop_codon:yes gene_type:complete